jgi:2,5-dihydroxypyridine 5,6-dioxygenase
MSHKRVMTNPSILPELIPLFKHQLTYCNLKPGELCLSITDMAYNPIYADACIGAALNIGAEMTKLTLPYTRPLPSKGWGSAVQQADLIVYSTTHTLHYTEAIKSALEAGKRVLMVVQPLHTLYRLKADPAVIDRTKNVAEYLENTDLIRIVSDVGTDLTMVRGDRPVLAHYGVADEPGHSDFWGTGMVETAPLEGSLEGTMVLDTGDQMFYMARYVENPVKITFRKGRIIEILGGLDAFFMRKHIESFNEENAWNAGHITLGTDKRALWTAQAVQFPEPGFSGGDAESYYGNVQVEIGSNDDVNFCGKNRSKAHLGHCMLNTSLYLDEDLFIEKGVFVPSELQ